MQFGPELVLIVLLILWTGVLTYLFFRFYSYHMRIVRHGKGESLVTLLDEILKNNHEHKKAVDELIHKCDRLEHEGKHHIQRVGLVRFNPFKDTGGDQSFILALVDSENSGVVISSLHTRTGTRWYAKRVVRGKGVEYALSDEEGEALKGAKLVN